MPLCAVLWDMDGLLVDSEPVWTVAEQELAGRLGGVWSDQLKAQIAGTRLDAAVPAILTHYGMEATPAAVAEASSWLLGRMVELFRATPVVLPGVVDLLAEVSGAGIPMALVSSSYRVLVDAVLAHGLGPFDVTLTGDEVVHGKPHPEPYLAAARLLGVAAEDCVVVEDSLAGVLSGEAAGCAVLAVPSVTGVSILTKPRVRVASSLVDVDLSALERLVG